jgi:hypothetical protein
MLMHSSATCWRKKWSIVWVEICLSISNKSILYRASSFENTFYQKFYPLTPHKRTHLSQKAHKISSSGWWKGGNHFLDVRKYFWRFWLSFLTWLKSTHPMYPHFHFGRCGGLLYPPPVPKFSFWKVWWPCLPASYTHIFILEGLMFHQITTFHFLFD